METSFKYSAVKPKLVSIKLIKPPQTSVVTATTDSTQFLTTTAPLDSLPNKAGSSRIQPQIKIHESPSVTVPATNSMQHTPTIVSSLDSLIIDSDNEKENTSGVNNDGYFIWDHRTIMLFFTEYEQYEKKFQKRKYQSKEAMFQAIAESFQERGYVNATKNHMKNKFKLLKKKWDKHIKRTMGKNSSGKGTKPLPYEDEIIKLFGKSHSGVPPFVAGRNEMVSQEDILQRVVSQHLSHNCQNENEEQSSIALNSPPSTLSAVNSESLSVAGSSRSSITDSSCSSLINTKAKVRDGKLALTLQSVKESICAVLQRESDAKQEIRTKYLTELKKCNELQIEQLQLQKERNSILQRQLKILERIESKKYSTQELSDEED
ncbi:uncharacterized protein [Temnothorax nylanderi]|uniref:uncharacterized protein n=1 Tax=Temnothorax nylanderi TaxID=102681 RepID=UPI003A87AE4E